LGAGSA
ncbi:hypothetical protein D046_8408B, partial [Vibrio parahaemolyticus V-223/04]